MEHGENTHFNELSIDILKGFMPLDYTLDMLSFDNIYKDILAVLPQNVISFKEFEIEELIACEVICSAICHKMNWDFLREKVYKKTKLDPEWLKIKHLCNLRASEIWEILKDYNKKERIQECERCRMIRTIAKQLKEDSLSFTDIFFQNGFLKEYAQIISFFQKCTVFSIDPQQKKTQLLFQTMSDYEGFEELAKYYKPTIDYHLIRLFIRRGIVRPNNQYAYKYVFDQNIIRKENTIATLRSVCAKSLEELCWITSLNLKEVNRIEWWIGRSVCTNDMPDCSLKRKDSYWLRKKFTKCPYYYTCYAQKNNNILYINEPKYTGNSY